MYREICTGEPNDWYSYEQIEHDNDGLLMVEVVGIVLVASGRGCLSVSR